MRVLLSGVLLIGIVGGVSSPGLVTSLVGQENNRLVETSLKEPAEPDRSDSRPARK